MQWENFCLSLSTVSMLHSIQVPLLLFCSPLFFIFARWLFWLIWSLHCFYSLLRPRIIVSSGIMTLWSKSWYLIVLAKPKLWRSSRHRRSWSVRKENGCWPRRLTGWGAWRGRSQALESSQRVLMTLTMGELKTFCHSDCNFVVAFAQIFILRQL